MTMERYGPTLSEVATKAHVRQLVSLAQENVDVLRGLLARPGDSEDVMMAASELADVADDIVRCYESRAHRFEVTHAV